MVDLSKISWLFNVFHALFMLQINSSHWIWLYWLWKYRFLCFQWQEGIDRWCKTALLLILLRSKFQIQFFHHKNQKIFHARWKKILVSFRNGGSCYVVLRCYLCLSIQSMPAPVEAKSIVKKENNTTPYNFRNNLVKLKSCRVFLNIRWIAWWIDCPFTKKNWMSNMANFLVRGQSTCFC